MSTYYLPSYVHACIADGHVIFLNLKKDEYSALPNEITPDFKNLAIEKKVSFLYDNYEETKRAEIISTVADLRKNGLITNDPNSAGANNQSKILMPKRDFSDSLDAMSAKITTKIFLTFAKSWLYALISRNLFPHHCAVKCVSKFKVKNIPQNKKLGLGDAIYSFRKIRPLFYTADKKCYFDCMVISFFLKSLGYNAKWIYGVAMSPFHAHCWVQVEDNLTTDELMRLSTFVPIMSA